MCAANKEDRPGLLWSVLTHKCPRCRRGRLFTNANPYRLATTMRMPGQCAVCGQQYELQTGFYFGTGYVSYGLSVMVLGLVFLVWALVAGLSYRDNSIFWCLGLATVLLLLLQPLIQRLARSIWIAFFVPYEGCRPVESVGSVTAGTERQRSAGLPTAPGPASSL